jgi:hypothetical protein
LKTKKNFVAQITRTYTLSKRITGKYSQISEKKLTQKGRRAFFEQKYVIPPEPTYKKNGVAHMGELLEADRLALN